MEFEKLELEVNAKKAGLSPVKPRVLKGASGIEHRFTLLFSDGSRHYAFDFYERVTEVEVVRSYAKKFDTGCTVNLVSPRGGATAEAGNLAFFYDMRILTPEGAASFFALERVPPDRAFG